MERTDKTLGEIQISIRDGKEELASKQIMEYANTYSEDPFMLLTCASLLRTIGRDKDATEIVKKIPSALKKNERSELEVAKGLRGIGYPKEAESILSSITDNNEAVKQRMRALYNMRRYGEAENIFDTISDPDVSDKSIWISAMSAERKFDAASAAAKELLQKYPDNLEAEKCYCMVLIVSGKEKDAEKFVKDELKKDKKSADANALAAYFMWMMGKSSNAGAYASKAVQSNPKNLLGMEILAYSLIDKKKIKEARIVAGAINESDPGNPVAMKILDMCRAL